MSGQRESREPNAGEDAGEVASADADRGTPPGMGEGDIELRAELARYAKPAGYPTDREQLLSSMREHHAPDHLTAMVQRLDPDRTVDNAQDLAEALGLNTEDERF